jgi:hypothetical protein
MMYRTLVATFAVLAVTSLSAFGEAKDDLAAAVAKAADGPNYSWSTTVEGGFGAGTTTGKTEKDGYTDVNLAGRNSTTEMVMKGKKAAIKTDSGWKTTEEITSAPLEAGTRPPPERMAAMQAQNFQTPLAQASDVVKKVEAAKAETDGFSAALPEAAAKQMLMFRRRPGPAPADAPTPPEPQNAKATLRVWTKDGAVTKLQYHVTGTVSFGGQDRDIDRTTTTELKDVGSTKVDVSDEVKKKLEG